MLCSICCRAGWRGVVYPAWRARALAARAAAGPGRAEEMRESAATVEEAGIDPLMTRMTVLRQVDAARHRAALNHAGLAPLLDAMLSEAP